MLGIQICSKEEWNAVKNILKVKKNRLYPYGEFFEINIAQQNCIFYHSGPTKTLSAGACQYAITNWDLELIIVLGTCGGVSEDIKVFDIVLGEQTAQYDIIPMRKRESIFHEIITFDLSWLDLNKISHPIRKGFLATADQSVTGNNYHNLRINKVIAADWETAAIAKICTINKIKCCVLRGVSDVPNIYEIGDASMQYQDYIKNTHIIMEKLINNYLPWLVKQYKETIHQRNI